MSDDFDSVFGRRGESRPTFTDRVARGEAFGGRVDPRPAMAAEAATIAPAPDVYKAFGFMPAGGIHQACEVRRWIDGTDVPERVAFFYRLLLEIGFTGTDQLRLKLPDTIIVVTGQNLEPLWQALMRQQVTFVQQFSKRVWSARPASGEALIEHIEITRP